MSFVSSSPLSRGERALSSSPPSHVEFPAPGPSGTSADVGPSSLPNVVQRPPHLPFRRISMPPAPGLVKRYSVNSVHSIESTPEEPLTRPVVIRNAAAKARPVDHERRRSATRLRPIDEVREAKRRKIVMEFFDTERSYVDGLNLVYELFLTPIIASLDTPLPLLERSELTAVFSNFIDIWNLHRSFFTSLSQLLGGNPDVPQPAPPLSSILLSHFPYLSLYTPFVTAFPDALATLGKLQTSKPAFAAFVAKQEVDERCGKLRIRDWLLTVVQRCPRYLLLLKDLINCTDAEDPEHASLTAVHTLVSRITNTLNTSLHTHAQTLALLALQRSTAGLPFPLISPGRTFLRRGPLMHLEGAGAPREREFLLFSDCLIWLAAGDGDSAEQWENPPPSAPPDSASRQFIAIRPPMIRQRSKSEAALPRVRDIVISAAGSPAPSGFSRARSVIPPKPKKKQRLASTVQDERWVYRGSAELVDVDVVVSPLGVDGEDRRIEILSPQGSFALYAASEEERDEWVAAIRTAKSSLLISLNAMHPDSTLTASASTQHLRRTLQALPHLPEDEASGRKPKRGRVEHFVPAIWVPDARTDHCMRCGRAFGWRRRRHHCRLCGRCVCSACSSMTFYIADSTSNKPSNKPARACDACYETVFPLLDASQLSTSETPASPTAPTMSGFPSWQSLSMPSLAQSDEAGVRASALLAVDLSRHTSEVAGTELRLEKSRTPPRIRVRSPSSRPRSYVQILEDFAAHERQSDSSPSLAVSAPGAPERAYSQQSAVTLTQSEEDPDSDGAAVRSLGALSDGGGGSTSAEGSAQDLPSPRRREDTARKHKRFSIPAIALQTTAVTARPTAVGEGKSKRFSLVLARGAQATVRRRAPTLAGREEEGTVRRKGTLASGAAATKLGEILGRKKG